MSYRITSRARPRLHDAPWPYRTGEKTLAQLLAIRDSGGSGHINFLGPLSFEAIIELLFRVKKIHASAAMAGERPGSPDPIPYSGTMEADLVSRLPLGGTPVLADEKSTFEYNRGLGTAAACIYQPVVGDPLAGLAYFTPIRGTTIASPDTQFSPLPLSVIKDENGDYWMDANFQVRCFDSLDPVEDEAGDIILTSDGSGGDAEIFIDVSIVLNCGTFTVRGSAYGAGGEDLTSASLSFTATEWFPYATLANLPAYDSETGGILNGGPGA